MELEGLRDRALEYLREHELDTMGCCGVLGVDLGFFLELREYFRDDFWVVEEELYARCEHILAQVALGKLESEQYQVKTAEWILARRKVGWAPLTKVRNEDRKEEVESNGKGREIIERYIKERGEEVYSKDSVH